MIQGVIVKGVGGFYYVRTETRDIHECRARGKFRKERIIPLVGDKVFFRPAEGEAYGYIEEILPRKNCIIRPAVANIDQIIVVFSPVMPEPDYLLIDKILLQAERANIQILLCVNKVDTLDEDKKQILLRNFGGTGYPIVWTSAKQKIGIDNLKTQMIGKLSCIAGQSGVGKSSLLNKLSPGADLETGELSAKIGRGKHTTRHAEIIDLQNGGTIIDTAGFSLIDIGDMDPIELGPLYPEFRPYLGKCRFNRCVHVEEPDCTIKDALNEGKISAERYARYKDFIHDLKEKWRKKYD